MEIPPECIPQDGPIQADSDIVGPGVLAAFFASAAITILAVAGGYLSQSLDSSLMGDLDRKILSWSTSKIQQFLRTDEPSFRSKHEARKEAVTHFILTLSDQQLVTGLAILASGTLNKERLTIYELSMLMSLACFSTTTHLATLDALQIYLKKHRFIQHIRVCGMLTILILLFYLNFMIPRNMPRLVPLRCRHIRGDDLHPSNTVASYLGVLIVIIFTLWGYSVRILPLYWGTTRTPSDRQGGSKYLQSQELRTSRKSFLRAVHLRILHGKKSRLVRKFLNAGFLLSRSFLWSSLMIWFSFTYGIANLILQRWYLPPSLDDSADYMGFGQVTAMFLLLLPFFSAGQAYYGYIEKQHHVANHAMHPTFPGRASTAPVTSFTVEIATDTLAINAQYTAQENGMMHYLAGDIYHIRDMEYTSSEVNHKTVLNMKRAVLIEYHKLKEYEEDISPNTSLLLFVGYVILHVLFATQLNFINVMRSTAVNFTAILLVPCVAVVFFFDALTTVYLYRHRGSGKYLLVTGDMKPS